MRDGDWLITYYRVFPFSFRSKGNQNYSSITESVDRETKNRETDSYGLSVTTRYKLKKKL